MFHYTKAVSRVGLRLAAFCMFTSHRWAKHLDKYPPELRFPHFKDIAKRVADALNVDLEVFGLDNLPKEGNFFMVSNHLSAFDPIPMLMTVNYPTAFVGKMELTKVPLLKTAMKALEVECIDRDNLRQSLKVMLKVEEDLRKGQKSWMIFPEGTRIRDQLLPVAPFHHGTFRPATKAGVPILPVAMYGGFRVFKKKPQFKKYPVSISFLKPMMPEDYEHLHTSDIAEIMHDEIQREITYHLRPLDHKIMSEAKDKKYRFNQIL